MVHDRRRTTIGGRGQAAADDLAQNGQVGRDAVALLRPAERQAEAGHHLVEDQQGAMLARSARGAARGSPRAGGTSPMLPATGSSRTAAIWPG